MRKLIGFGIVSAIIGFAVPIDSAVTQMKIEGALQYPPLSVGEDAQPPPPARMVPPVASPPRIELGVSGSSQPPTNYPYRVHLPVDRLPMRTAPLPGARAIPPPTSGGN